MNAHTIVKEVNEEVPQKVDAASGNAMNDELSGIREAMKQMVFQNIAEGEDRQFILLDHQDAEVATVALSNSGFTNAILFIDPHTTMPVILKIGSIRDLLAFITPMFYAAKLMKERMETQPNRGGHSELELALINKLLEIEKNLTDKGYFVPIDDEAEQEIPTETSEPIKGESDND